MINWVNFKNKKPLLNLSIINSDLWNTFFYNYDIRIFTIIKSKINETGFFNVILKLKTINKTNTSDHDKISITNQLKQIYLNNKDIKKASLYYQWEMELIRKQYKNDSNFFQWIVFYFQEITSDYWNNPSKALLYLLLLIIIYSLMTNINNIFINAIPFYSLKLINTECLNFFNSLLILIYYILYWALLYLFIISLKRDSKFN